MKKLITIVITIVVTSIFFYLKDDNNTKKLKELFSKTEKVQEPITLEGKFRVFADSLATILSNKKYDTIFENGSLGKYSIGDMCFKDLGFSPTSKFKQEFLKDTLLQEECFRVLCMINKYRMRNYIDKYEGTEYNDILISESGLLAGAHIIGATTLKTWFAKKYENSEVTHVIEKMEGFNLDYIVPAHTYKIDESDLRVTSK